MSPRRKGSKEGSLLKGPSRSVLCKRTVEPGVAEKKQGSDASSSVWSAAQNVGREGHALKATAVTLYIDACDPQCAIPFHDSGTHFRWRPPSV